jgi:hypothetical protein
VSRIQQILPPATPQTQSEAHGKPGSAAIGGYYRDDLVQTADGWKIERLRLDLFWQRGQRSNLTRAREDVASGKPATRIAR